MTNDPLLPCPHCNAELSGVDWLPKDDWKHVEVTSGFTFQGKQATRKLPTVECPDCGEKVII